MQEEIDRLSAIIATQTVLAQATLGLPAFMDLAVQQLTALTPSTGSVVELVDGADMVYRAASDRLAPFVGLRLKVAGSLSGASVVQRRVMLCMDTQTDPLVDRQACEKLGLGSMVVAPLFSEGKAVGVIKITSEYKHAFSERDVKTLEMIAGLLGAAIARHAQFESYHELLAERAEVITSLEHEIAQRRASEALFQRSEERIRLIIESAHDGFICMDAQGIILEWNHQAERIYGWKKEEAIGQELAALIILEEHRAAHRAGVKAFAQTGKSHLLNQRLELTTIRRDKSPVLVELSLSSMRDGDSYIANAFVRDISQRKEVEQQLLQLARYDSLTGLANRRHFEEKLSEAIARTKRSQLSLTLMFLDIDHFKQINDTYGHAGGDEALIEFAKRIRESTRVTDTPARLAGDEFVVIFEGLKHPNEIKIIAEKILAMFKMPFTIRGLPVAVTASMGLALYGHGWSASKFLGKADKALYQAKSKGRYQYVVADQ